MRNDPTGTPVAVPTASTTPSALTSTASHTHAKLQVTIIEIFQSVLHTVSTHFSVTLPPKTPRKLDYRINLSVNLESKYSQLQMRNFLVLYTRKQFPSTINQSLPVPTSEDFHFSHNTAGEKQTDFNLSNRALFFLLVI